MKKVLDILVVPECGCDRCKKRVGVLRPAPLPIEPANLSIEDAKDESLPIEDAMSHRLDDEDEDLFAKMHDILAKCKVNQKARAV